MIKDVDGFNYPIIDESKCINCRQCINVCGAINDIQTSNNIKQQVYNAITNDNNIWLESSSGGMFSELCSVIYQFSKINQKKVAIFGATMKDLKVFHTYVTDLRNLSMFRKSKYIQSTIGSAYKDAKEFLLKDYYVVFSGTPCQISGLKNYLKKEYDNLICIDFICHGVGSQSVFDRNIQYYEAKYNKRVKNYIFRYKNVFLGNIERYSSLFEFIDGTKKIIKYDCFNRLFLSEVCLRKSCLGICRYRNRKRTSDITIADLNNKMNTLPTVKDYRNYSVLVINTKKGDMVFQELKDKITFFNSDIETLENNNPLFSRNIKHDIKRNEFFKEFNQLKSMDYLTRKYGVTPPTGLSKLKHYIPYNLKLKINKYRKVK